MRPIDRPLVLVLISIAAIALGVYLGTTLELNLRDWLKDAGPTIFGALGSAATIGAGVLAWRSVQHQLTEMQSQAGEMRRQTSAVAVQTLTRLVESIEQEISELNEHSSPVTRLSREFREDLDLLGRPTDQAISTVRAAARKLQHAVRKHASRNPQEDLLAACRAEMDRSLRQVRTDISGLTVALADDDEPLDRRDLEKRVKLAGNLAIGSLAGFEQTARRYREALHAESKRIWRQIRQFESQVVADREPVNHD